MTDPLQGALDLDRAATEARMDVTARALAAQHQTSQPTGLTAEDARAILEYLRRIEDACRAIAGSTSQMAEGGG